MTTLTLSELISKLEKVRDHGDAIVAYTDGDYIIPIGHVYVTEDNKIVLSSKAMK